MGSRGLAAVTALVLAAAATLAVFLYLRGVAKDAEVGGDEVRVVVAKQDILAGSELDDLVDEGAFTISTVPEDAKVQGAVTSLAELKGKKTSSPILAGEQISTARIQGSGELPGGVLGIPDGFLATTVALDSQRLVAGAIQTGDTVAIYGTFEDAGSATATVTGNAQGGGTAKVTGGAGLTVLLAPEVKVLDISANAASGAVGDEAGTTSLVTLALAPRDSQKLVFAQELGRVWLSLLPPGQKGSSQTPLTFTGILK